MYLDVKYLGCQMQYLFALHSERQRLRVCVRVVGNMRDGLLQYEWPQEVCVDNGPFIEAVRPYQNERNR